MQNEVIQIKADEDGCVYVCDLTTKSWKKICDVAKVCELPDSVRKKLRIVQQAMEALNA